LNLETYLERLHWEEPVVIEEPEGVDDFANILEFVEPE